MELMRRDDIMNLTFGRKKANLDQWMQRGDIAVLGDSFCNILNGIGIEVDDSILSLCTTGITVVL